RFSRDWSSDVCSSDLLIEGRCFRVLGAGAVYIVDGSEVTHSNIAEARPERTLSMHDVRLHVLSAGDRFDLSLRKPVLRGEGETRSEERRGGRGGVGWW